jgi:hypothetical protein
MIFRVFIFFAAIAAPLRAALPLPLQNGEKLTYRVSWAVVAGAGEINISAQTDTSGPVPRLVVSTTTATRGFAQWVMPFRADAQTVFDLKTGQLVSLRETSTQKKKTSGHTVTFDHSGRRAIYTAEEEGNKPRVLAMPPGDPTDLMMALLQTRSWDLKPGEKRDVLVLFDDDFYELTIHMARYEDVQTPMGRFKTIVLEPRMDKTPPKGMFKRGSSVRIWIAQDDHRLPVKFEVMFKIGTGTATLEAYAGPPAAKAAARAPSSSCAAARWVISLSRSPHSRCCVNIGRLRTSSWRATPLPRSSRATAACSMRFTPSTRAAGARCMARRRCRPAWRHGWPGSIW